LIGFGLTLVQDSNPLKSGASPTAHSGTGVAVGVGDSGVEVGVDVAVGVGAMKGFAPHPLAIAESKSIMGKRIQNFI
jgi:hypothetical protein